jgi:acetyltransferase-like isoleucine patch superfamily enzyme
VVSGHVEIGAYCLASFFVVFASGNHNIEPDKNINDQDVTVDPIIIGDDVWIGACAIITGGVHVGSHAVIGAGSVVTHDIPEWEIWAGNPAKKIGDRRDWKKNKIKQKIP